MSVCGILWECGGLDACVLSWCVFRSRASVVALSVLRIRVMRVMMCEAVVFCARATLRLSPHSQPNVFLILFIPHHQSASSDSDGAHMKLQHSHVHTHSEQYILHVGRNALQN